MEWTRREWIKVFEIFQVFLVENTLVWAPRPIKSCPDKFLRKDTCKDSSTVLWPALVSTQMLFSNEYHKVVFGRYGNIVLKTVLMV